MGEKHTQPLADGFCRSCKAPAGDPHHPDCYWASTEEAASDGASLRERSKRRLAARRDGTQPTGSLDSSGPNPPIPHADDAAESEASGVPPRWIALRQSLRAVQKALHEIKYDYSAKDEFADSLDDLDAAIEEAANPTPQEAPSGEEPCSGGCQARMLGGMIDQKEIERANWKEWCEDAEEHAKELTERNRKLEALRRIAEARREDLDQMSFGAIIAALNEIGGDQPGTRTEARDGARGDEASPEPPVEGGRGAMASAVHGPTGNFLCISREGGVDLYLKTNSEIAAKAASAINSAIVNAKAEALEEAADALKPFSAGPSQPYTSHTKDWLRDRARQMRD